MGARLRWVAPALVLGIAVVLRFWGLDRPSALVFDELYYVRDAISQLAHGFPTVWPDSDPSMAGPRATAFTDDPANAVHPPLGKWLIGLGILAFGPESGWGWRSASALAGVLTVGIVMRLGWLLSRSLLVASTAGFLLAIDGVHVVLSRVGLLDGFLTLFVALGALLIWRDQLSVAERLAGSGVGVGSGGGSGSGARAGSGAGSGASAGSGAGSTTGSGSVPRSRAAAATTPGSGRTIPILWARPWLIAAAAAFGAAAAVKWSGLYPLAAFLVFITLRDLVLRLRSGTPRPVTRAAAQAGITAALTLPVASAVYLASWIGWIVAPDGWGRSPGVGWPAALLQYHRDMLGWHGTLSAPHPFQSHPLSWPFALRPTSMYEQRWSDGCPWAECVSAVAPLPNPLVTWGGVIALGVLFWVVIRSWRVRRHAALLAAARHTQPLPVVPLLAPPLAIPLGTVSAFVLVGYLSGWLPWVATVSRSAVFQFYAVVLTPFAALAIALVIGVVCRAEGLRDPGPALGLRGLTADEVRGRRAAVALFLAVALALALFFFPVWSGQPVADWFWRAHLWLPGWG